jgi:transcriptional regulator with XRE-family HTH domain
VGRKEKEIVTDNAALRELAEWLRAQRARRRLTNRELAERTGFNATTLQRAASGQSVPQRGTVLAYARGCEASLEDARRRWGLARQEHLRLTGRRSRSPAPSPAFIRDLVELSAALREVYEKAGAPSLRTMEERAGGYGALPRSSAHRIVNKRAVPRGQGQLIAFLRACEVPGETWEIWTAAFSRAWRFEKEDEAGLTEVSDPSQLQHTIEQLKTALSAVGKVHAMQQAVEVAGRPQSSDRMRAARAPRTQVVGDPKPGEMLDGPRYHRPMIPRRAQRQQDETPAERSYRRSHRRRHQEVGQQPLPFPESLEDEQVLF